MTKIHVFIFPINISIFTNNFKYVLNADDNIESMLSRFYTNVHLSNRRYQISRLGGVSPRFQLFRGILLRHGSGRYDQSNALRMQEGLEPARSLVPAVHPQNLESPHSVKYHTNRRIGFVVGSPDKIPYSLCLLWDFNSRLSNSSET